MNTITGVDSAENPDACLANVGRKPEKHDPKQAVLRMLAAARLIGRRSSHEWIRVGPTGYLDQQEYKDFDSVPGNMYGCVTYGEDKFGRRFVSFLYHCRPRSDEGLGVVTVFERHCHGDSRVWVIGGKHTEHFTQICDGDEQPFTGALSSKAFEILTDLLGGTTVGLKNSDGEDVVLTMV